ncbi:MAG TPA: hypothetical protein VGO67_01995 [Verrucomicrobiae bacterium]|jgi:hypothetical protein
MISRTGGSQLLPEHITATANKWNGADGEATEADNYSCFRQGTVLQFYSCYYESKANYNPTTIEGHYDINRSDFPFHLPGFDEMAALGPYFYNFTFGETCN